MQRPRYDILGFGIVTVDDFLVVDRYPSPGAKTPVRDRYRQGGGLTGTALVAAARLGARAAFAGVLGTDELSTWTRAELEREGVDCAAVITQPDARVYHAIIIVDRQGKTRTIFHFSGGFVARPAERIDESLVGSTRVLFVDQCEPRTTGRAARIARDLGVPVVADFEHGSGPEVDDVLGLVDHLIVPLGFARSHTGVREPADVVRRLAEPGRFCTAVTAGERGCWFVTGDAPDRVAHQPAFPVEVADTTGCGDVFHGAYAAAVAWGWPAAQSIRFAAATAALKATAPGGRAGIPDRETVDRFLTDRAP